MANGSGIIPPLSWPALTGQVYQLIVCRNS
jgi:hypothetical protein